MSRLRRLVVSDRFFFLTCRLLPRRGKLQGSEFERLARVARERREVSLPKGSADIEVNVCATPGNWKISVGTGHYEKVEYIHLNPVRAGLVERAEDWPWSSVRDYAGNLSAVASGHRILPIDRILLPADARTRI